MKQGTKVSWSSQSNGFGVTKTGTVLKTVKKGTRPDRETLSKKYTIMFADSPNVRSTDSPLVVVRAQERSDGSKSKAKPKLYWPNPAHLQSIE